ncbi:MAG: type II secretion system F family protein [Ornithinibacter sp.]
MTGLLIGLLLGTGLLLIWMSFWVREPGSPKTVVRVTAADRLADEIVQAGFTGLSVRMLVASCALALLLVAGLVQATVGVAPIAACFGLMAGSLPLTLVRRRARRRRARLRDLWPDAVDNITSGVRAGMALPEALGQLGVRGPLDLREPFTDFAHDYRLTGRFNESLDRLKERLSDPVGDRLVESLRIAREVGGSDLGRLLRTLSGFLREDARTRAELETRQSWTVNAARLAAAAPWLILAMLSTNPESVTAYSTPLGAGVLAFGAVLTGIAYWSMMRIGRLPEDERVLR